MLPSVHWFKYPGICVDCYPALTSAETDALDRANPSLPQPDMPFPSVLQAFVLLPLFVVFVSIPISMMVWQLNSTIPNSLKFLLVYIASLGLPTVIFSATAYARGRFQEPMCAFAIPHLTILIQFAVIALVSWFASGTIATLVFQSGPRSHHFVPGDLIGAITRVIVAPICEETLFRGIVLHSFLKRLKRWKAIVAASLLFALFHIEPVPVFYAFFVGMVLGWIYSRYRSIVPTIIVHAFLNASGFVIALYQRSIGEVPQLDRIDIAVSLAASIVSLAVVGIWVAALDKRLASLAPA
jgi:membrane protease YdiL (CAAX protease family)